MKFTCNFTCNQTGPNPPPPLTPHRELRSKPAHIPACPSPLTLALLQLHYIPFCSPAAFRKLLEVLHSNLVTNTSFLIIKKKTWPIGACLEAQTPIALICVGSSIENFKKKKKETMAYRSVPRSTTPLHCIGSSKLQLNSNKKYRHLQWKNADSPGVFVSHKSTRRMNMTPCLTQAGLPLRLHRAELPQLDLLGEHTRDLNYGLSVSLGWKTKGIKKLIVCTPPPPPFPSRGPLVAFFFL